MTIIQLCYINDSETYADDTLSLHDKSLPLPSSKESGDLIYWLLVYEIYSDVTVYTVNKLTCVS
jgi:hypothetical protein